MRNPEYVLNSLREHSAQTNYSYDRLYRILYNQDFLLLAYQNIYANKGNMTAGTDGQTIDAMSLDRINRIIHSLKDEKYVPNPARRTYIPKKNGKMRPLGIPSIDDKLIQEAMRMILEAIYDSSFEDTSHGFRPGKSCHTALRQIQNRFTRCKWFVEGDIKGFFDNIDHNTMIAILKKRIKDEKFLRLIRKFLKAGYMEDSQYHSTYSGAVQGGIISPILANIYLDQFDKYMKEYKEKFDKGIKRQILKSYTKMGDKRHRIVSKIFKENDEVKRSKLLTELKLHDEIYHAMPRADAMDKTFRRLQYTRYADDFLIGVIGSKDDAKQIKEDIAIYLKNVLKLEMSQEKTLITIATDKARFLGYDIRARKQSNLQRKTKRGCYARNYGGHIVLEAPTELIKKKLLQLDAMEVKCTDGKEIWKLKMRKGLCCWQDIDKKEKKNKDEKSEKEKKEDQKYTVVGKIFISLTSTIAKSEVYATIIPLRITGQNYINSAISWNTVCIKPLPANTVPPKLISSSVIGLIKTLPSDIRTIKAMIKSEFSGKAVWQETTFPGIAMLISCHPVNP